MNTNTTGTTQKKFDEPTYINFDALGNLWVPDRGNCRAVRFDPPFATNMDASVVLGQANFTSKVFGGGTQNGLSYPAGVFAQPNGNIWVADTNVHRTLRYDAPISSGMNANLVLGQSDFTGISNVLNASGTNAPKAVCVDIYGNAWVIDSYCRALRYTAPLSSGMASTKVLGQADFTSSTGNRGGTPGRNTLLTGSGYLGMILDQDENLWIADTGNNRIMKYNKHDFNLVLTSATPNTFFNNSVKNIQLAGNDFVQGVVVTLKKSGSSDVTATNVVVSTSSQLTCDVNLVGYATGQWNIEVTYGGFIATKTDGLDLKTMSLYSVTPSSGFQYVPVNVSIAVDNFLAGTSVYLQKSGMTIPATNVNVVCSTQITCSFTLLPSVTGQWILYASTGSLNKFVPGGFNISDMQTTSIAPSNGINNENMDCVINGENFLTGMDMRLQKQDQPNINAANLAVQGNNQLTARFNLVGAATGYWDLYVATVTTLGSCWNLHPSMFTVNTIIINSITPITVLNGGISSATIIGTNLVYGSTVTLTKAGQPSIAASNINYINPAQLSCDFNLTSIATGYWNVTVTSNSIVYSLPNALQVDTIKILGVNPPDTGNNLPVVLTVTGQNLVVGTTLKLVQAGQSDINAANINVVNATQLTGLVDLTGAATGYWDVVITSGVMASTLTNGFMLSTNKINNIAPTQEWNNKTVNVTVNGEGIVPGTVVALTKAAETSVYASNLLYVSTGQLTGVIDLSGLTTGYWNVVITSAGMNSTLVNGFLVRTIKAESIDPATAVNNAPVNITLSGADLVFGTILQLTKSGQSAISASSISGNATQMTGSFDLTGVATGYWNVVITSGAATSTLTNAFAVSTMRAVSVTPTLTLTNKTLDISLTGVNLLSGTTVALTKSGESNINATAINVVSATQLTASFDLTGAATGYWSVVITSGPLSSVLTDAIQVKIIGIDTISSNVEMNNKTKSIVVQGDGMFEGATVKLTKNGETQVNATDVVANDTSLTCNINLTGLATGYWDITVTTGNSVATKTNALLLKTLSLLTVTPSSATNSGSVSITIAGENILGTSIVSLTKEGQTSITATSVVVSSDTQLTCSFDLTVAATGYWNVVVTSAPLSSALINAFEIKANENANEQPIDNTKDNEVKIAPVTGEVKVEVPEGTFTDNVKLTVSVPAANLVPEVAQVGLKSVDVFVEIKAEAVSDNASKQPEKAVTITINYRDGDVTGIDESKLVIAYYEGGRWITIPSVAYPDLNKIVGTVRHFTMFRLVQMQPAVDLKNVLVYPNPYRGIDSTLGEGVVFAGLTANAKLKIFNVAGELVYDAIETGGDGRLIWDTKNKTNGKVASGTYVYFISDLAANGLKKIKTSGKFAVIR